MSPATTVGGVYCMDTCSFTELRRTYPRPNFARVWDFLADLIQRGRILSVDQVLVELNEQDDDVTAWVNQWPHIFITLDQAIQTRARQILLAYPRLIDLRKTRSSADPFLIAATSIRGGTLVTEENPSGGPNRVKIPDVARGEGVTCIKLLGMLQSENFQL